MKLVIATIAAALVATSASAMIGHGSITQREANEGSIKVQTGVAHAAVENNQAFGARDKSDGTSTLTMYSFSKSPNLAAPEQFRR